LIILIIYFVKSTNYEAPHYSVFSILLSLYLYDSNILLSTQFSDTLNLYSPLNVRDKVPHQYRITGKIVVLLCSNFYVFRQQTRIQRGSELNGSKHYPNSISS
jgi:hypothetical protein